MCISAPGRVIGVRETGGVVTAQVAFEASPEQVCLCYIDSVVVGDLVLVAGGAIVERVTEQEAAERALLASALLEALRDVQTTGGSTR